MEYYQHIKSDTLTLIRALHEKGLFVDFVERPKEFTLIIDANVVFKEIIWMTTRRKNPKATTELYESLQAGTIKAIAPSFLEKELEKHIYSLAAKKNVDSTTMLECMYKYLSIIELIDVEFDPNMYKDAQDPKDLPYTILQEKTGAFILSHDTDIKAMGGEVLDKSIIKDIRDYSRIASKEYVLLLHNQAVLYAGGQSIIVVFKIIKSLLYLFNSMRSNTKWTVIILLTGALLIPQVRQKIADIIGPVKDELIEIICDLAIHLLEVMEIYNDHAIQSDEKLSEIAQKME